MAIYQKDKPAPQDDQDVSQVDLQQNFESNNETWARNHVAPDPNDGGNRGKHTIVEFVQQSVAPSPEVNECVFYAKDVSSQTLPFATYIKADSSTANVPLIPQITSGTSGNYKSGGITTVWGVTSNVTTGNTQSIAISFGALFSSTPWFFGVDRTTATGGPAASYTTNKTSSGCTVTSITNDTTIAQNFNWVAIGPSA